MRCPTHVATISICASFALSWAALSASASSPQLSIITPRGVQRGTDAVLTFRGNRLQDAEEVFFYEPGFEVVKIEPKSDKVVEVTVKVAADCRLGEHTAQVRCKSGISEYRTFYVGPFAAVEEKEPNTIFEQPQPIGLNLTVTGIVQSEDVDYFVVEAKKGQRISAEIEGMRLGTTMFDPYVAILDEKRFELSADDDTPLLHQDAVAAIVAPEDGKYIIEVREAAYGGNGNCHYRLHVGTFPRPTAAYPVGGKLGEETEIRFLGDPAGEIVRKLTLPAASVADFGLEVSDEHGVAPSEVPFRLFEQGNVLEQEPNDEFPQATSATLPLAFNGIIQEAKDVDLFKFQAKKGEVWEIECYARRVRSPLDPVMMLHKADGGQLAANDDSRGPDSYIRFNVPADGEYFVKVFDHLTRGGADFVYRIEFTPVTPKLTLGIPRVRRYSQDRQTIYVPKGNRFATLISAKRENFGGPLTLDGKDLPQGVTMHAREMPANMTLMPVVFEAAADAPIAGKLVAFTARHSDPNVKISGRFENTADLVRYRNNQILWKKDVERLAMAVIDEVPFKLEIVQPKVPIVRDGAMQLKIVAHKKEGWDEQINVQFPFRPPGIGAASSVNMPKGQNEVLYPLNANGGAAIGKWPVYVIGSANVNGAAWAASQLAELEIADRYVQFEITRTAVEQGQSTQLFCKITHNRPFEGAAKVQLLGLPNKVAAPELEFTKDTAELVFNVTTDPASPAGRHKNVFAQVTIMENGEPIVHRNVGSTELRIDKPLPVAAKPAEQPKPEPTAKAEEPKKPAEKPLTRLEQLRLEAKKRAEAATSGGGGSE